MGKLVFLCILASIGYFGYNKLFKPNAGLSGAAVVYSRFAEALAYDRFDEAKSFAQGRALSMVEEEESRLTKDLSPIKIWPGAKAAADEARSEAGLGPLNNKPAVTASQLMEEIAGRVTSATFKVTTEQASGESSTLEVNGSICRQQPGCMGIRCTNCIQSQHIAEMCKSAGSWNVCS